MDLRPINSFVETAEQISGDLRFGRTLLRAEGVAVGSGRIDLKESFGPCKGGFRNAYNTCALHRLWDNLVREGGPVRPAN